MISSTLGASIIIAQIAGISCLIQLITCPQDIQNVSLRIDSTNTWLLQNGTLTLTVYDNWKLYMEDESNVNVVVHNMLASLLTDRVYIDSLTQTTIRSARNYVENNYELHGFAQRVSRNDYYELGFFRMLTVPSADDTVHYMPDAFRQYMQNEIETCLEIQLSRQFGVLHTTSFDAPSIAKKGCKAPELHYKPPATFPFQEQINKVADIVVHKVIEEFLDPIEGEIEAPELMIKYDQYWVLTGNFSVFNGRLRDLRTVERKSDVTISRNDEFLTLSGSFNIHNVSLLYNDYNITGGLQFTGNNVTINFEGGVIADVIVHLDNSIFPCGIKLHELKVTSNKPGKIRATDASSLTNSSVRDEFRKQNTEILRKFSDKLKEYIASEMAKYECEDIKFLDFLEKSLSKSLKASNETEYTLSYFKELLGIDKNATSV